MATSKPRRYWKVSDDFASVINPSAISFPWECGTSKPVWQRNIDSFHRVIDNAEPGKSVIDISRSSRSPLGNECSAFNLTITYHGSEIPVECLFQGSKVFGKGGPHPDMYFKSPLDIYHDPRIRENGPITGFEIDGIAYPNQPKTLFYDWIYCNALHEHPDLVKKLVTYDVFTDIRLKEDSLNSQAEACAIYVSLCRLDKVEEALSSLDSFRSIVFGTSDKGSLFDDTDETWRLSRISNQGRLLVT